MPVTKLPIYQTIPEGAGALGATYDPILGAVQMLGGNLKSTTLGVNLFTLQANSALGNNTIRWIALEPISSPTLMTGFTSFMRVPGVYTAGNENSAGLYSYSGGVLTRAATTGNVGTLWSAPAANTFFSQAFTAPVTVNAGMYFAAILYTNSAQTTAPSLFAITSLNTTALAQPGTTNNAKLFGTSTATALPTSINMTDITVSNLLGWVGIY